MLNIKKNIDGGKVLFTLSGRIDSDTAPDFEQEVRGSLSGVTELILDIKDISYISSAGLRVLLATQKQMNKQGKMKVLNVNKTVMEVFEITGFSDILTIE